MKFALHNREATARFGAELGARLRAGDVIALLGDLGAGKTTLTQAIARGMGITAPVTSPTYTLIQEIPGRIPLFHADPYRLERPEDALGFGFEEYFERGGVVVVEWADRIEPLLPPERLTLHLGMEKRDTNEWGFEEMENGDETPRLLNAMATGDRYLHLLAELADLPALYAMRTGAETSA